MKTSTTTGRKVGSIAFRLLFVLMAERLWQASAGVITSETWVACSVDLAALQASGLQREVFQDITSLGCFAQATYLSWAFLACYDSSATCTVWEMSALAEEGAVKDISYTPGIVCKFPDRNMGCTTTDGSKLFLEETAPNAACSDLVDICTDTGLVTRDPTATVTPNTSCVAPFIERDFGCIHYNLQDYYSWCTALEYCTSLGGTVISPDTTEAFDAMRSHLTAEVGSTAGKNFFVGMQYFGGKWQWLSNGRSPGPDGTQDWATGEPSAPLSGIRCARLADYASYKLDDVGCTETNLALCEIKL